jgi:hypothetical protein
MNWKNSLRLILGAVFLYSGAVKALAPNSFLASVLSFDLPIPRLAAELVAIALPWLEIITGGCLISAKSLRAAELLGFIMSIVFVTVTAQAYMRGLDVSCGCFGSSLPGSSFSNFDTAGAAFVRAIVLSVATGALMIRRIKGWIDERQCGIPAFLLAVLGAPLRTPKLTSFFALASCAVAVNAYKEFLQPVHEGKKLQTWLEEAIKSKNLGEGRLVLAKVKHLLPDVLTAVEKDLAAKPRRYHALQRYLAENQSLLSIAADPVEKRHSQGLRLVYLLGEDAAPLSGILDELLQRGAMPMRVSLALARIGAEGHGPLFQGLRSRFPMVRLYSMQALRLSAKQIEIVPRILHLLNDVDPDIRVIAAAIVREYGKAGATQVEGGLLAGLGDSEAKVREACAQAIGVLQVKNGEALARLSRLICDKNEDVRFSAIVALKSLHPAAVKGALESAILHEEPAVRAFAVTNYPNFASEASTWEFLSKAAKDPVDIVRLKALELLASLQVEPRS